MASGNSRQYHLLKETGKVRRIEKAIGYEKIIDKVLRVCHKSNFSNFMLFYANFRG